MDTRRGGAQRTVGLALTPLLATLVGCGLIFGSSVAVVNPTDQTFYLRVGHRAIWLIPPNSEGIGPTDLDFPSRQQVEILREDCQTFEGLGLTSAKTITLVPDYSSTLSDGTGGIQDHLTRDDEACPMG